MKSVRLAVDIGGTFTDVALLNNGNIHITKVLTTHDAPERAFLEGMQTLLDEAGVKATDLDLILHGTTLATNAIIERRGAKTGLITTEGYRDVLEIADEGRFEQYDLMLKKPAPLVSRPLRLCVNERIDSSGREITPLDEESVVRAAEKLRDHNIESVAIGFIHAYSNPANEIRAREIVQEILPDVTISISSEVCPEIREYERFSTTCANAYVRPIMDGYLSRLEDKLATLGADCPLLLMTSGGGLTSVSTARAFPIRLVESGPAGGAILASRIAEQVEATSAVSFDMGGTTAKICLIEDAKPESSRTFEVARTARFKKGSGLPLRIPVIEMIEIGAGGGSIAAVNNLKQITVGPESAESMPGPACYDRGGDNPTVTDADLVLGRIEGKGFANGSMDLRDDLSKNAFDRNVGQPLDLSTINAAFGVCETIDETMTNAARVYSVERGRDLANHTMIAFGGAAPLHAARMAEKLQIPRIIIPQNAGVGSALGFLSAPISYETVRSHHVLLSKFNPAELNSLMDDIYEEVSAVLPPKANDNEVRSQERLAYARYVGQGHEVSITLPNRPYEASDADTIKQTFESKYEELFNRTLPDAEIEILTFSLKISIENNINLSSSNGTADEQADNVSDKTMSVFLPSSRQFEDIPVYHRNALQKEQSYAGPCLIQEQTTTTFVSARFDVSIDPSNNIVLDVNNS